MFILLFHPATNFLYVDPGSGNMLIQMLIAALLGVVFYFRAGWNYIKSIFRKKKDDQR